MTPRHTPSPRDELEMRVTALLLGELSPEEAADLQARIAAEPDLAALHTRLSKALELLREATALPDEPAPAAPVQLSPERRERFLAYFKTIPSPTALASKPIPIPSARRRRDWSWLPPLGIAAALVALFGFLAMPKFASVTETRAKKEFTVILNEAPDFSAPPPSPPLQAPPLITAIPPSFQMALDGGKIASNSSTTIVLPKLNADGSPATETSKAGYTPITADTGLAVVEVPQHDQTSTNFTSTQLYALTPRYTAKEMADQSSSAHGGAVRQIIDNPVLAVPAFTARGAGAAGEIAKSGAGEWTFSGSNTYTGGTTVTAGSLTLGNANSFGGAPAPALPSVDLNGQNQAIASLGATNTAVTGVTINGGATLAINGTSGQITESSQQLSTMHIAKARDAALKGDSQTLEDELTAATKIWPRNPALADISKQIFSNGDIQQKAVTDSGAITKSGNGTLSLVGSAGPSAPTSNIYLGGSSVSSILPPLPQPPKFVTATDHAEANAEALLTPQPSKFVTSDDGSTDRVIGLGVSQTPKFESDSSSLSGNNGNPTQEFNLHAQYGQTRQDIKVHLNEPTFAQATAPGDDGKDLNRINVTGNTRTRDKVIRPGVGAQNPTSTPALNFENGSQVPNLYSGGLVQAKVQAEANRNPRVAYQEDPVTVQAPQETINNGNSTTFTGTLDGRLATSGEGNKSVSAQNPAARASVNYNPPKPSAHAADYGPRSLDELGPRQSFTTTESRSPTLAKGSVASNNSNLQPKLDHIYNSPDELLFGAQAGGQAGGTTGTPRPALTPQTVDNLRPYLSTQNKSPNLNVESRVTQQADAGDTANRAGSFKHQFTRRELDPTVSLEQNELEAKDLESQKLAQAVKERDEANRPFDPKAEPLQPDAPAAVPATGKPAQTGGENNHPHRSPHRTFVVDDAQPALAAPAAPAVPAAAAAPLAPSPSAPPVAGLAGVFTVPQLQTATPGHHKKAKQPQGASAASSTASASSSATDSSKNTAISADAINALQFPSGVPGIPGVDVNQLPAPASGGQSPAVSFAAPRPAAKKADTAKSAETSEAAIAAGKAAMKDRDYEKAAVYFKRASDLSPDTGKKSSLRKEAVDQFSTASVKLATELITEGRYQQAQDTLETALGEDYDPHNKKAVTLLSHLQQPDYFNKKITPEFRQNVEQVKQWFVEAQGLYDTGRLDLAKQRCEKILELDPYNRAAREFEEKVAHAQDDYGIAGYNGSRAKQVADVDNAWAMPVRKFNVNESASATSDASSADTAKIRHKLETIVIPKIDLHEVTVREAIDFLKKKSVELDGSSPAGSRGANIVLKLGDVTGGKGKAGDSSDPANARITLSLNNVPMIEALKYVTGLANLKFKVEPHAVSVVPLIESTDVLVTKEWKVTPGLIPTASETGKTSSKDADAKAREAAKNWLITNGIQFNGTASATYNPKTGRLIVRDTPDQLDLVDQIVENGSAAKAKPKPETPAKAEPKTEPKPEAPAKPEAPSPLIPQPEVQTQDNAFSTFSLNVSDVAFKLAAASLEQGRMPDPSTVRSEEFINAFDYRDPEPAPGAPLAFIAERAHDPFAQNRDLLRFSVKTAAAGRQPGRPLNIVLLLDKSGSMERADRVNIVREALRVLTTQLQPTDTLSIVTFARTPHLWADGVAGNKVADLIAKVSDITPEGGTNLEAALDLAYDTAQRHFAVTSINRVVLFTDGAANLGDVNPEALTKKVEAKRKQGVALDCFGIGWEGYNDDLLEQLTRTGDGRYGFINTPDEAKENFAAQLAGALQVAASDVKVQVEFNPHRVTAYRQIGYAKHQLTKEQFRDNSVAAAQIGAAESGNALYVVAIDPQGEGDIATVRVRYRVPGTSDYREHEWVVSSMGITPSLLEASPALRLAGTAAAFSEMLAANPYAGDVSSDRLLALLDGVPAIYGADPRPQKLEWMIRQAKSLGGR